MCYLRAVRILALAALLVPTATYADGILELGGALTFPIADKNWTDTVDTSPELGVRFGVGNQGIAGLLGVSWTPENLDAQSASFPGGSTDISGQRFRILGNVRVGHLVAPKFTVTGRLGAGVDITHGSFTLDLLGNTSTTSDTDVGYAFDAALGGWYALGNTQLGFELAIPIGHHSKRAMQPGELTFDYNQLDIELWFVVRLSSHL